MMNLDWFSNKNRPLFYRTFYYKLNNSGRIKTIITAPFLHPALSAGLIKMGPF